ncbi:MAG: alpha-L-arabinofuranosidase C-terminal domain-containing protein [Planctomycetota bacterium]|jgi:alpha-N-arabinofuranosidase
MKNSQINIISGIFLFVFVIGVIGCSAADKATLTIDASDTGEPISKYVYGQFIEHLGRCIYGGIWSEMLEDRKFYYPVTDEFKPYSEQSKEGGDFPVVTGSPWKVIGKKGCVTMITEDPYVGDYTPQIDLGDGGVNCGIEQMELALIKDKEYTGRVVIAGEPKAAPVKVLLVWGEGQEESQTITIERITGEFIKYPFKFKAGADTDSGKLQVVGSGKGKFMIGTVSLMPADNVNGMRPDTLEYLKELDAPVYRWPGGNFVSGYDWRDGVGDVDKRPPKKNPAWTGLEHNDFGLDEFVAFCREVNAEPMIAVNTGFGDAHSAYEEVMYANSSVDTHMGKWRAENGNPAPYNVEFWCVGNEMYGEWQLGYMALRHYTLKHNRVAKKMWQADESIKLVGVGNIEDEMPGEDDWSRIMLEKCADYMDLISEHWYVGFGYRREGIPDVPEHVKKTVRVTREKAQAHRRLRQELESLQGKDIRIALDEWNYWYGPHIYGELGVRYFHRDALGIAAGLHEMFRNSDLFYMANYAQTVNVIGCIKTTKTEAGFATTAMPLMLYRKHFGTIPVKVEGVPEELDITAAWTEDKEAMTIAIVNPTEKEHQLKLEIKGAELGNDGDVFWVQNDDPEAFNTPGLEPKVKIEAKPLEDFSDTLKSEPLSITLYKIGVN